MQSKDVDKAVEKHDLEIDAWRSEPDPEPVEATEPSALALFEQWCTALLQEQDASY